MSYSDYGSYNWLKENGEWVYKPEFEDSSLERGQMDKTLESLTGLKLDIVLDHDNEKKDLPWYITRTSHSVIGTLNGYAVVSYKGQPYVIHNGIEIDRIDYDDVDDEEWNDEQGCYELKEDFVPKVINIIDGDNIVKVKIVKKHSFWSAAYVKNGDIEHLSLCGYGLGEHWWLDENGKNNYDKNNNFVWLREKESLSLTLKILEL